MGGRWLRRASLSSRGVAKPTRHGQGGSRCDLWPGNKHHCRITPHSLPPTHSCPSRCADIPEQFREQYPAPPLYRPEGPLTDEGMRWWLSNQGLLPGQA